MALKTDTKIGVDYNKLINSLIFLDERKTTTKKIYLLTITTNKIQTFSSTRL